MKSKTLSAAGKRLVERLKSEHGIDLPADVVVRRTYAGWSQKAHGAWSWFFYSPTVGVNVGSDERIVALLKCKKITLLTLYADTSLIIENTDY